MVEVDFQEVYGVDLSDPGILEGRTWRWLRIRILGLLSTECRVQRLLNPIKTTDPKTGANKA